MDRRLVTPSPSHITIKMKVMSSCGGPEGMMGGLAIPLISLREHMECLHRPFGMMICSSPLVPALLVFSCLVSCCCCCSVISSSSPSPRPAAVSDLPATPSLGNSSDRMALLAFKSSIVSAPVGALASWNDSFHFCRWEGVECGGRRHPERVTGLDLRSLGLSGPLHTSISNLTFLKTLDLGNNSFHGHIPGELVRLCRLRHLNLSYNSLEGEIPVSLGRCTDLRSLHLGANRLVGTIPRSLSNLSSLEYLNLRNNRLGGGVPPWLGNLTSLSMLYIRDNSLVGNIPPVIGELQSLIEFLAARNKLTGTIPSSIYNLSSLEGLDLSGNQLSGTLPPNFGDSLPNLEFFSLSKNQLHGSIPSSIANASALDLIQLFDNSFSGVVPSTLGTLKLLTRLLLYDNQLEAEDDKDWSFITSLANCTRLSALALDGNRLGGVLPRAISNLSTDLELLALSSNSILGSIPGGIGDLTSLQVLVLHDNILGGAIPTSIGKLQRSMTILGLQNNQFSGQIPSSLSNLTRLDALSLAGNKLQGPISPRLGKLEALNYLDLADNKLNGVIPKELVGISSLSILLNLSHNSFTGVLPIEVGQLRNLGVMDISENSLSGEIIGALGDCVRLEYLSLRGNDFQGVIPRSFVNLRGLEHLDLSHNHISGNIPEFLQNIHTLKSLNLSFNDFDGEVPDGGIFQDGSAVSVFGNDKLCGGIPELHLLACSSPPESRGHRRKILLATILPAVSCLLLLVLTCMIFLQYYRRRRGSPVPAMASSSDQSLERTTYNELLKATEGFSPQNLIGVGSFGSVYKANMDPTNPNGKLVAVKVINLQQHGASRSFMAECEALRNIRHRNLLKIITACSSVDFNGNDFKALVFEFMPNGSLEQWLHPAATAENVNVDGRRLSLAQRLNVAVDVASALAYLHHHHSHHKPIVHRDLKPSNVLLDNDMTAHVSDFGLARFLITNDHNPTCSVGLKGSIGYVAPEYGMGCNASIQGDVFSYGVLLLEMITGRRPTDACFVEDLTLHKFVERALLLDNTLDIVDPHLLVDEDDGNGSYTPQTMDGMRWGRQLACLVSVARLGVMCSKESPRERLGMEAITKEITAIRDTFLRKQVINGGR